MFNKYELIKIKKSFKNQWYEYVKEFEEYNEILTPDFYRTNFDELFFDLKRSNDKKFLPEGWVPYEIYFLINKSTNYIVGAISIRLELNDFLYNIGGNIGYGIRPKERQKGFATYMLNQAIKILSLNQKWKNQKLLITCDAKNIASKKVIINNGGKYENTIYDAPRTRNVERYWIYING